MPQFPTGRPTGAESCRKNLVQQWVESKQWAVVDDPTPADAVLTRIADGGYLMVKMGGTPVHGSGYSSKTADVFLMLTSRSKQISIW